MSGQCSACRGEHEPEPGDAGLCEPCRDERYPPITESRGKRWSPLQIGMLSVVCDVMMIPSILAFVRGIGELNAVASREAAGLWRPEHPKVRTGAVWALVAGALRPLIIAAVFLAGAFGADAATFTAPPADELTEVLMYVQSQDPDTRDLALEHFDDIASTLNDHDVERSLEVAGPHAGDGTPITSRMIASLARARSLYRETARRLYPQVDAGARAAIFSMFIADGSAGGLEAALSLLEADDDTASVVDPAELRRMPEHAAVFLPRLAALREGHEDRDTARLLARQLCDDGIDHAAFASMRTDLMFDLVAARGAYRRVHGEVHSSALELELSQDDAVGALRVLGCVDDDSVAPVLEQVARGTTPQLAAAAVDAMLRRGDRVTDQRIGELGARPESRWILYRGLQRAGAVERMPPRGRTSPALAESYLVTHVAFGGSWRTTAVEQHTFGTRQHDVFFYVVGGEAGGAVAIGPFEDGQRGEVQVGWSEQPEWSDAERARVVADLVARWEERT